MPNLWSSEVSGGGIPDLDPRKRHTEKIGGSALVCVKFGRGEICDWGKIRGFGHIEHRQFLSGQ